MSDDCKLVQARTDGYVQKLFVKSPCKWFVAGSRSPSSFRLSGFRRNRNTWR